MFVALYCLEVDKDVKYWTILGNASLRIKNEPAHPIKRKKNLIGGNRQYLATRLYFKREA